MAKRKSGNPFLGRWLIEEMDQWDVEEESEHVFGRGWAVLNGDQLSGMIFFHDGDESGFTATKKN